MGTVPFLLNQLRPLEKGDAALTQAAASIALSQGQPQTIVDVLHGRAFRFYSEGIRQYLAIRTGSTERADHYLAKLRAFVAKTESSDLIKAPVAAKPAEEPAEEAAEAPAEEGGEEEASE